MRTLPMHQDQRRARLVLIARDGTEGPSHSLGDSSDIGRLEGDIRVSDDRYVSPRHARIMIRGGVYFLRDMSSANGVYARIPFVYAMAAAQGAGAAGPRSPDAEQALEDQDLFLVGQQVLRFEVVRDAEQGFRVAFENGTLLFGTPAAPRYGRLTQYTVEGAARDVFHVKKADTVIGRESGDIVFTEDPFLSRRHAVVRVHNPPPGSHAPRRFTLTDLSSSNGTFLKLRDEICLRHGDQFRIGQQLYRFDYGAARAGA
jgi:pSer/pThr/pTyr-binding forkhead associated (FHA) protein